MQWPQLWRRESMKEPKDGFKNGCKITSRAKKHLSYHTQQAPEGRNWQELKYTKSLQFFQRAVDLI